MGRSALPCLLPVLLLGACHASSGSNGDNVSINTADNGELSVKLPFGQAAVKLPESTFRTGTFDIDGVKMVPGTTLHGFNMNAGDKGATIHLAFEAPKSADEVRAYFLDEFKQKGDTATQSGNAISGKTKEGDQFTIDVQPAAQGSTGTITVQSKH